MAEMFEELCIDWNKFTAKDAAKYTKEGQEHLQKKEYIDIIKEIARTAALGQSEITLSKKLTDYTISKLKDNGFGVAVEPNLCYTTVTGGASIKNDYLITTIKW